ncbi:hypothetical protein [Pedobacter miscanthi]|uniref:hypothetical protein n=1 Tax=Pedobacter miscanthi TaxID=2259170 RepID=UPI00293094CF|nr:hypothetical protein [Pedobacter miscanthi]
MKTFKELSIHDQKNDKKNLIRFLDFLKKPTNNKWTYRVDLSEDYAKNIFKSISEVGCFESPILEERRALVWLVLWSKEIKIANIVPTETGSLGIDYYNRFLELFNSEMIMPAAKEVGVDVLSTSGYEDMETLIGTETYRKLVTWANTTNPNHGNGHPLDFERWAAFLTTSFEHDSKLTAKMLERWLIEDKDWEDNEALQQLMADYEYGLELLEYYVNNR